MVCTVFGTVQTAVLYGEIMSTPVELSVLGIERRLLSLQTLSWLVLVALSRLLHKEGRQWEGKGMGDRDGVTGRTLHCWTVARIRRMREGKPAHGRMVIAWMV